MRKGIYFDIRVRVENAQDLNSLIATFKPVIKQVFPFGTPDAQLTGEVKRIRLQEAAKPSPRIEALLYLEAEQAAADNFYKLAMTETQALMNKLFATSGSPEITVVVEGIEENTSAVDELAEEEIEAEEAKSNDPNYKDQ